MRYIGYVLKQESPFYSYRPTSSILRRALMALNFMTGLGNGLTIEVGGPYIYDILKNKIFVLAGPRLPIIDKDVMKYVDLDTSRMPFYSYDPNSDKIEVNYPIVKYPKLRISVSRLSFTTFGSGRVVYNASFMLRDKSRYRLMIIVGIENDTYEEIVDKLIRLLGTSGLGRYRTIGGGRFKILKEEEICFFKFLIKTTERKYFLSINDYPLSTDMYGSSIAIRVYDKNRKNTKLCRYFSGGLIKEQEHNNSERPDCRKDHGNSDNKLTINKLPLGFPIVVKRIK